ncbi:MAG TPA: HDOD domain-containing protein [Gallionellaceae bacterium]|nr:HDOD domain-containing protein [Gallionellaceae bacterium]
MNLVNHGTVPEFSSSKRVEGLLQSTLADSGIPARPAILDRVHIEMDKEEPDLNLLARIISADVALAGGLISISNSPNFGFHGRVRSVNEALMVLGLNVACRAIAGLILRKLFPVTLTLERFWDASASIARLSGWLAQYPDIGVKVQASDAYTFGLFRDCGIAVLLNRFPFYHDVLAQANAEQTLSFTHAEEVQCPTNHAVIGSLLAQSWYLPEEITTGIRLHHEYAILKNDDTTQLPAGTRGLIAISQLAEHIFQHHTGVSKSFEWQKSKDVCMQLLKINEDQLARLYEESAPVLAKYD